MAPIKTAEHTPVYDADAHICEPPSVWKEYCDPKYRDLIIRADIAPSGRDSLFANGEATGASAAMACIPDAYGTDVTWDDIVPGSYDPAARLAVMDDEGLDAALMFPSLDLLTGEIREADVAAANARAYNRWMADFVSEDPERLFGMGIIPLQSVDAAVAEIELIAEHGLTGVTFRPERYNGLALFDEDMDRVWSAAEDHDLTVGIHGSFGSKNMTSFASTRYDNPFFVHMVCHPFEQMASVMEVCASGILDDHPRLRIGFFESGMGWLPYWLERLNEHKESMGNHVPRLEREPTEIFSEQCFVTMEAGEGEAFAQLADMGLAHTVVWGSDYPHYDCTFPGALAELDETFEEIGRTELRDEVVYTNARRFMGLG